MDNSRIQTKVADLVENLNAIETTMFTGDMSYSDLILYLQYDMPLESINSEYAKFKDIFADLKETQYNDTAERFYALIRILKNTQHFIIEMDTNGSRCQVVYKEASDVAGSMISYMRDCLNNQTEQERSYVYSRKLRP